MKFQKGQKVRVKSKEELLKWFEENNYVFSYGRYLGGNGVAFRYYMFKQCGRLITTERHYTITSQECYSVEETDWTFLADWLLPAYSTFVEIDDEF